MPRERFRIHGEAAKEITDAISWFEERNDELAQRFMAAVNTAIDKILTSPAQFGTYLSQTRYVRVAGFDYVVVYRDVKDLIHVVAVAHTSRRPGYWRHRLRDIEEA